MITNSSSSILPIELILTLLEKFNFKTTTNSNDVINIINTLERIPINSGIDLNSVFNLLNKIQSILEIPKSCSIQDEEELTPLQLLEKERYLNQSPSLLSLALSLIKFLSNSTTTSRPTTEDLLPRIKILLFFGRFTDNFMSEGFVSSRSKEISTEIMTHLLTKSYRYSLIHYILTKTFPPLFKPHPKLNPETGRVLNRPRGGERGILDWYEESEVRESWRNEVGLGNVLKILLEGLEKNEVEELWPLILPPLLAYLDDYEIQNKILGTSILSTLLEKVDESLLRRTGVGSIFEQSLSSCFSTLSSPLTPLLVSSTHHSASLLLSILHPSSSSSSTPDHFIAQSQLLSEGIIQIWEFKSSISLNSNSNSNSNLNSLNLEIVVLQVLEGVMNGLGKGVIRFLGILIPRLTGLLKGEGLRGFSGGLRRESLKQEEKEEEEEGGGLIGKKLEIQFLASKNLLLLIHLISSEEERIRRWKGIILGSIAKVWQELNQEILYWKERDRVERVRLEDGLRILLAGLGRVLGQEEFKADLKRFEDLDPMFLDLIKQDWKALVSIAV